MYTYGNRGNPPSASQWFRLTTLSTHSMEIPMRLLYQFPIYHNLNSLSGIGISAGYFTNTDGMYWATGHAYRISQNANPFATSLISTGLAYVFPNASAFHLLFDFQRHFTRNHAFSYNYSFDNFDTVYQNMTEGEKFRYWRLGITLSYVFNTMSNKDNMLSR
jgi:hypothetical protein